MSDFNSSSDAKTIKQGYLKKEGKIFKTWNKRWFVMDDAQMITYFEKRGGRMKGCFTYASATVSFAPERENKKRMYMFKIETPLRVFFLNSDTGADRDEWVKALTSRGVQLKESDKRASKSPGNQRFENESKTTEDEEEDQTLPTSAESSPRSSLTKEELEEMIRSEAQDNADQSAAASKQPTLQPRQPAVRRETVATIHGEDTYETFTQAEDGDVSDEEAQVEEEGEIRNVNQFDTDEEEDPNVVVGVKEPVGVKDALERMGKNENLESIAIMCCRYLSDRLSKDPKLVEAFIENQAIQILLGIALQHKRNRVIVLATLRILCHLISLSHSEGWKTLIRLNGGHRLAMSTLKLHHDAPDILRQVLLFLKLLHSSDRTEPPEEFFTKDSLSLLLSSLEKHITDLDIVTNCIAFCSHVSAYPNGLSALIRHDGMTMMIKALMRWLNEAPQKILPTFWAFASRVSKVPVETRSRSATVAPASSSDTSTQKSSNSSSDKTPAYSLALEALSQASMAFGVVGALLTKTMRTHATDKELIKTAIATLKTLATSSSITAEIVHILKTNIKDRVVAYNIASLMYNLRQPELLTTISNSGIIAAITPTLREYSQDENLVMFVLSTLKFLLHENEDNQKKFVEAEGLPLLIRITRGYCTRSDICTIAVEILFYLSDNDDYTAAMGQEKGGIEAIMEVIDNNEHNDDILSSALKILVDLAVVSDIDEEQQKDILSLMISFLKERKDSGMVAEKSMIVLYIVSEKYDPFELQEDEVEILLDCVKMHSSNDHDFVTVVFDLFGTLSKLPQNRDFMLQHEALETLDKLASQFMDDEKIQGSAAQFQENMGADLHD